MSSTSPPAGSRSSSATAPSTPGVPLDPAMAALDAYRAVLANLRDAMVSTWDGTAADLDPEYLHDFRVAVRRTRSVLGAAKHVRARGCAHRRR